MALLEAHQVSKSFAGVQALVDVSISLDPGEIVGLFGPNGAGKTTLFNVICGVYRLTGGEVYFGGRRISRLSPWQVAQLGIGRTFQIVKPFGNLTSLENVLLAVGHRQLRRWFRALSPARGKASREAALRLLKAVGVGDQAEMLAKNMTLGSRKRLELARSLALEPKVLLLDEPLAGLSHDEARALGAMIVSLKGMGMGVLLVEHNMQLAMELCDRVVVLDYGQKIAEGTPEQVRSDSRVIEAYLGVAKDA